MHGSLDDSTFNKENLKAGLSPFKKIVFKNDEKCILFHIKGSFRSQAFKVLS